ncbi:hypothetical protein RND71_021185 [Anisodus tanguticus]|uniref:Uncharacterized protein n=1 Tax=Anisodus tanguticus TaxID=243964 RepID=A0AAE1RXW0_9SOLA|nr:hypothetical protein RND71_021185 [Anisodus tanguticus]
MMCWWAHDPNCEGFKYHLARVPDYLWLAEDGMIMHSFGSQLWDCSLATQAIIATGLPYLMHQENTAAIIRAFLAFKRLYPGYREKEIEVSVAKAIKFLDKS